MLGLRLGLGFIADDNIPPSDIVWAGTHTIAEDAALGAVVGGALSGTDPEGGPLTFSVPSDAGGRFGVSGTNIIVTGILDFETATSHDITVRATDQSGGSYDETFTITVTNVSETPPANPPPDGDIDDDGTFTNPPIVVDVDGAVKIGGKKAAGSSGKFLFDIGTAQADRVYTIQYDPDFSLLTQLGKLAMVGFGFKLANDFHLVGLRGDGSTGLDAYKVHGDDLWNQTAGFTVDNGGDAAHGTQAGPNWLRLRTSADGNTYTLQTSNDGSTWVDEYTASSPTPFGDVTDAGQFGIAGFFDSTDTGPFSIAITLWTDQAAVGSTPSYRASGADAVAHTATALNVPYPASVQAGEILLLTVNYGGNGVTMTTPADFTRIGNRETYGTDGAGHSLFSEVLWKRATGSESGNLALSKSGVGGAGTIFYGKMHAYQNVLASGDPIDASSDVLNGATTLSTMGSITTTGPNRRVVCIFNLEDNDLRGGATPGPATGWTQRTLLQSSLGNDGLIYHDDIEQAAAGSPTNDFFGHTTPLEGSTHAFALKPT